MKNFLSKIEVRHKTKKTVVLRHFEEIYKLPFLLLPGTEIWQILNNKQIKLTTIIKNNLYNEKINNKKIS
jgi:hypothetical protein